MKEEIKQKLVERYKYLYENKELILSLCIEKDIQRKYYEKKKKEGEKKLSKVEQKQSEIIKLINLSIEAYEKALITPEYYLMNDIPSDILNMFEEFLLSDNKMEDTILYKLIEFLNSDELYLTEAITKINGLLERRKHNKFLCNKKCLTTWRILTYVRNNNKKNKAILDALDKYYNIDRYISTGINWKSGYYLLDSDATTNEFYINNNSNTTITGEVQNAYEYSALISKYDGNEFEQEDDYFDTKNSHEHIKYQKNNNGNSKFITSINVIGILSEKELEQLYLEIHNNSKKSINKKILKKQD